MGVEAKYKNIKNINHMNYFLQNKSKYFTSVLKNKDFYF